MNDKGYTENVIVKCYEDTRLELKKLLEDKTNYGSGEHHELSNRVSTLADLIYNSECDKRDEYIDRRCE